MKTAKTAVIDLAAAPALGKAKRKAVPAPVEAPKAKAKGKVTKAPAPTLGVIVGTDGALKFSGKAWAPAAQALVATVYGAGCEVGKAGETAIGALVDLFRMGTAKALGYANDADLARALVKSFNLPGAESTMYGWATASAALHAVQAAKVPGIDALGSDALRLVAQHGKEDPALMAKVATDLLNEPSIRSPRSNRVDVRKAREWLDGDGKGSSSIGQKTREEKVKALATKAKRYAGTKDGGIDLLTAAIAYLRSK